LTQHVFRRRKRKKKGKGDDKEKDKGPQVEDIKIEFIVEANCVDDMMIRSAISILTTITSRSNFHIRPSYNIIPHSKGEAKYVLELPLNACAILTDLDKTLFKEFSFKDILLKIEFTVSNEKNTVTPELLESLLHDVYPFHLLVTEDQNLEMDRMRMAIQAIDKEDSDEDLYVPSEDEDDEIESLQFTNK